jgi:vitamin B12 transporter
MKKTIWLSIAVILATTPQLWAVEEIEKIVVSAVKTSQKASKTTSNVEVITSDELQDKNINTLSEALNLISGVSFTSSGGIGQQSTLYVRGMDRGVLLLIDGVRANDVTSIKSLASFEHILTQDIEQIEVIKGASSGIWGADASSGVINVITKKAKKDGFSGTLDISHGSYDTTNANAILNYKSDKGYISIGSQVRQTEGLSAMTPYGNNPKDYEKDGYENTTNSIKAGVFITPKDAIDLSYKEIKADVQIDGYDPITFANNPNHVEDSSTKERFKSANYKHTDSDWELSLYANDSDIKREYPLGYTKLYEGEIKEYGANSKINYANNDFVLFGADYKGSKDKVNDKEFTNRGYFLTNYNIFNDIIGKETILTESIRRDEHNKFDDKTTFKVGLKQSLDFVDGLSASANYATSYNAPSLYNLYAPYGSGNEKLTPEEIKSFDVSLAYKNLKVTYFDNKIENMIDYDMALFKYNNIAGTSKIKGYEVAFGSNIAKDTAINLNYTNLDAKDKDGKKLARRPDESLKFGLDYYGFEDLHLGAFGEYVGERFDRANESGRQTGKYTTANLNANYSVNPNYNIYAKVENLTDKYYQSVDGYSSLGRTFSVGMRLDF